MKSAVWRFVLTTHHSQLTTHLPLPSLIRIALLATIGCAAFVRLPLTNDVVERLRSLSGLLPTHLFRIAFADGALQQRLLLPDGFAEPRQKRLVIAQSAGGNALPGALCELLLVLQPVPLQFLQLGLGFPDTAIESADALRQTPLGVADDLLNRLQAFGAIHSSPITDFRAARLSPYPTFSCMSCCRKRCMVGHRAIAASMRGSLPFW